MKLHSKIFLSFVLITFLPLGILFFFYYLEWKAHLETMPEGLIQKTLLIAGFTVIIITLTAYALSTRVLLRPIYKILQATEQIRHGDYEQRIEVTSHDEIGLLTQAFNMMSQSLHRSERDYRTLFENLNVGVYRSTGELEGRCIRANSALVRLFGYESVQEFLKIPIMEFYQDPEDRIRLLEDIKTQGAVKDVELALKKKNGEPIWVSCNSSAHYDEHEHLLWIDGILEDITDRKQVELELLKYQEQLEELVKKRTRALQESEQRFASFMNHLPGAAFMTDLDGQIVYVNRPDARIRGIELEKLLNHTFDEVFPKEVATKLIKQNRRVLANGLAMQFEERVPENGETRYWLTYKFPIYGEEHPLGIGGISIDITERKRVEEALLLAKFDADAANQAKSAFLTNMSHELRTPLTAILGNTQMLRRDQELNEDYLQAIETIHRCGEHLLALINDVLDLSKIEVGKIEIQPAPFHLRRSLKALVEMIRFQAEQKGLFFSYNAAPEIPSSVLGDERRLRQILLNLLSNAVKFTEQGTVTLRVTRCEVRGAGEEPATRNPQPATRNPQPVARLRFEVEDTGIGIPPDKLGIIFHPFQQITLSHLQIEGTGLGLSISQRLIHLMGGELHVQSTLEQGSIFGFDIELPVVPREETQDKMHKRKQVEAENPEKPEIILPAKDELQHLFRLAKRGNPQEILLYLNALEHQDSAFLAFIRPLREWVKDFHINRIYDYLKQVVEKTQ